MASHTILIRGFTLTALLSACLIISGCADYEPASAPEETANSPPELSHSSASFCKNVELLLTRQEITEVGYGSLLLDLGSGDKYYEVSFAVSVTDPDGSDDIESVTGRFSGSSQRFLLSRYGGKYGFSFFIHPGVSTQLRVTATDKAGNSSSEDWGFES